MRLLSQKIARLALAAMLAAGVCCGMVSCQSADSAGTGQNSQKVVGNTDNAYAISFMNESGKSVSGIQVKQPGDETFGANMLESDKHFTDGSTITLAVPKSKGETDGTYVVDIKLTFNDGMTSVLHSLDVKDFDEMTLSLQGKVGYVTYQSKTAKRTVSTLELQLYYYTLDDPEALARDAAEEEEEKRRLEKLEEDLKKTAEELAAEEAAAKANSEEEEDVQSNDLPDDPIEVNHDGDDSSDGDE